MTVEEESRVVQTLDGGRNKYYVYALCKQDGTPFYIGKGCGHRVFDHENAAQLAKDAIDSDDTLTDEGRTEKFSQLTEKIKAILEQNTKPQKVIIKWGLSEQEAYMCESSLINLLGFMEDKHVYGFNLTNIVNGHASSQEKESVADVKTKARTIEGFLNECAIPERGVEEIDNRVAFIKINKLYQECFDKEGNVDPQNVKECVRGFWPIAESKRNEIEYVFALYRRRVVGVYHVVNVHLATNSEKIDFPVFPVVTRKLDRWMSQYSSVEQAQQDLSANDFERFIKRLQNEDKTEDEVLAQFRRRVYFSVDDNVPDVLRAYMNTLLTKDKSGEFLKSQWPVQYNF